MSQAKQLPIVKLIEHAGEPNEVERAYYADLRLREYRLVSNPHMVISEYEVDGCMEDVIEDAVFCA